MKALFESLSGYTEEAEVQPVERPGPDSVSSFMGPPLVVVREPLQPEYVTYIYIGTTEGIARYREVK